MRYTIDHPASAFGMWLPKGPMESASPGLSQMYPDLDAARAACPVGWTIGRAVMNGKHNSQGQPLFTVTFVEVKRSPHAGY